MSVVGLARADDTDGLTEAGADLVVSTLDEGRLLAAAG